MTRSRALLLLVTCTVLALALVAVALVGIRGHQVRSGAFALRDVPSAHPMPGRLPRPVSAEAQALAIVRHWDQARAGAWARADPGELRQLYLPASRTGRRDVAMLRAWQARGLRVQGLRMQVLATRLHVLTADRLVLVVVDRVATGWVVANGTRVRLPRDQATSRTISMRRVAGSWLVAEVRPDRPRARP